MSSQKYLLVNTKFMFLVSANTDCYQQVEINRCELCKTLTVNITNKMCYV